MAKEDKPLEYQRRIARYQGCRAAARSGLSEAAGAARPVAQAAHLDAARRGGAGVRAAGAGHRRQPHAVSSGPLSEAHAMLREALRGLPHAKLRRRPRQGLPAVPRWRGASGQADRYRRTPIPQVRCAECHVEHRGKVRLAAVANGNCTAATRNSPRTPPAPKFENVTAFRQSGIPSSAPRR